MSSHLVHKKIIDVMKGIGAIGKDRDNKAQGFKFRGIDDIYNELHQHLATHGLFSVPEVLEERREERATRSGGTTTHVILKIKYSIFAEDGSSVSAVIIGEGADSGDKATNKAMSIAHKYFFLQLFAIPTIEPKDPDEDSHEFGARPAKSQEKQMFEAYADPRDVPQATKFTRPAVKNDDPWQFKIPRSWKQNPGKSLEELGSDGVVKLLGWLSKQEKLSAQSQQVFDACERALKQRESDRSDSAYDHAKAGAR